MKDLTLIFPKSSFLIDEKVFPPLGIMYLSAYLKKKGFSVQCLDLGAGHTLDMAEGKVIGVSFTTPQREEAYKIPKYFKGKNRILIAGGPHPTHMADECRSKGFTFIMSGEGEDTLLSFLTLLKHDRYSYDRVFDINDLPFPDRDALPIKDYKYFIDGEAATPIMTSRGCPYNCSFCAKIFQNCLLQNVGRTIREIEYIRNKYGFKAFMIFDDIFIMGKERLTSIANSFEGRDYIFRCFVRSNLVTDRVCNDLVRMGVKEVGIGIESGSDTILESNMKGTTRGLNLFVVNKLKDHGIRVKAFIIVGLPGENDKTIQETINWLEEAKPDDVDITIFQPLPGSDVFKNPEKHKVKINYDGGSWYKGKPGEYQCNIETENLSKEEILNYREKIEKRFKNV